MSLIKHFDDFNWTGSTLPSYWSENTSNTWTGANGTVTVTSTSIDEQLIHQTDANLGLPISHEVETGFAFQNGIERVGVVMLSGTSATTLSSGRVRFALTSTAGSITYELQVNGTTYTAASGTPPLYVQNGTTYNLLRLRAEHQGGGVYIFTGYINNVPVVSSPPIAASWSNTGQIGLVARRGVFGVANPTVAFLYVQCRSDQVHDGHPQPTDTTDGARTPITVVDESASASPGSFPFAIGIKRIIHKRQSRQHISDMGYANSHRDWSNVRRVFESYWIGSKADFATLQAFHRDTIDEGLNAHFTITIRPLGIGSIKAAFLDQELKATIIANNIWRCEFTLVEVV